MFFQWVKFIVHAAVSVQELMSRLRVQALLAAYKFDV